MKGSPETVGRQDQAPHRLRAVAERQNEWALEDLRFFEECAQKYGWTDEPGWVARVWEWRAEPTE